MCAQAPSKLRRIGLLSPYSPADDAARLQQAFLLGLRERGWFEGKNVSIEYRYADGKRERLAELAADLVRNKVEVIVASTATATAAAQKATKSIPIVMAAAGDPVATGLVESLARPGGNTTGMSQMSVELAGKRLELLKEMVPKLVRVAVLQSPQSAAPSTEWEEIQNPAKKLRLELHHLQVQSADDFDKAFDAATRARAGALYLGSAPIIVTNLKRIAELAIKHRLPSTFFFAQFADAGGLLTYGVDRADLHRRAASYVDKILKGAKPSDLPVEQPTKFELVVNMSTAKALGITVPQTILIRADRLIQ